jgi:hypothetical protein
MGHCTIFESGKKTRDFEISPYYNKITPNASNATTLRHYATFECHIPAN